MNSKQMAYAGRVRRGIAPPALVLLGIGIGLGTWPSEAQTPAPVQPHIDFDRQIRPIFSDKCYACHGPDEKQRMMSLRFDQKDGGLFSERNGYVIVKPGDAAASRLYQRISSDKAAFRMPPPATKQTLSPEQIELIKKWIDEGAKWETHWAYTAPKPPLIPKTSNPAWARNPIDSFVLAKLDQLGWKPSAEADRAKLLRRVTFDLTGLPPTPEDTAAFLADRSPDAYEKTVDRLLNSPRYGERMAMAWLDLARYADTHGYHIDSYREMWHWRDWVIGAFNRNEPFDQFTIEQVAGDLLPNATLEQKIATGFNRNHMINFEGGAIPEEYQNEYVVDRVETTAATWMGLTLGCARCHDHKYDPILQKDFYRFYAFFNTISEDGLDGQRGNAKPYLQLPSDDQQHRLDELKKTVAGLDAKLDEKTIQPIQDQWEQERLAKLIEPTRAGLVAHYELDANLSDSSGNYRYGRTVRGDLTFGPGMVNRAATFDGDTQVQLDDGGGRVAKGPFALSFWLLPEGHESTPVFTELEDAKSRRGVEVYLDDFLLTDIQHWQPRVYVRISRAWPAEAIAIRMNDRLDPSEWHHVVINYDASGHAAGLKVFFDGRPGTVEVLQDTLAAKATEKTTKKAAPSAATSSTAGGATAVLEIGDKAFGSAFRGGLDDLRIYDRPLTAAEALPLFREEPIRAALVVRSAHREAKQKKRITEYFLSQEAAPELRAAFHEREKLNQELKALNKAIPTTMVMAEMEKPRETAILGRGDYRNRGEVVTPGVPGILPPFPAGAPANRLTLARWLVSPENPLTARVVVNRFWASYFGLGIVKTPQDFGSQGDPPVNQELLDWLATEFIRSGWDVKAMQRLIVTSAAYRQDSVATPEMIANDPENRYLARGPRFRLPAEMVRDNALAVSGLLKERVGGPSVSPYQPPGLWEDVSFGDGFTAQSYIPSHGDDLYRRSVYTVWKRTSSPPALVTFDAPDREKCTARRLLTNTPLQALVLLNDTTYVEASRALATRALHAAGQGAGQNSGQIDSRIRYMFELVTSRPPEDRELSVLRKLEEHESETYQHHPDLAKKLLAVGESPLPAGTDPAELAAWTTVASALLNLDETITKE
jgi:mono/diheme cytochrome c family protein